MNVDIGQPENYAYCNECRRNVGGPYFDGNEARWRRTEHNRNVHLGSTYSTGYQRALKPKPFRIRTIFQG